MPRPFTPFRTRDGVFHIYDPLTNHWRHARPGDTINFNTMTPSASYTVTCNDDSSWTAPANPQSWPRWGSDPAQSQPPTIEPPEEPDDVSNLKIINPYKVGCDPEFVIVDPATGELQNVAEDFPQEGMLGYDHGGRVVELRPRPSRSTYRVLQGLYELLSGRQELNRYRQCKWKAGGVFRHPHSAGIETLGGHVHFDIPYAALPLNLVNALDALSVKLEQLDILPKAESRQRKHNGFGSLGDIRPSGAKKRLEYRTPASWLYRPETAFFCLTGYKLAALDPNETIERLAPNDMPKTRLQRFYSLFKGKDADCDRLLEKLVEAGGLDSVRGDPDADMRETWREVRF